MEKERIVKLMRDQIAYKYAGWSFEEWLSMNDGSNFRFTGWVVVYKKTNLEDMRKAWNEMDAEIKVGLPCTVNYWSDSRAATIVEVSKGRKTIKVGVKHNRVRCIDFYSSDYEIYEDLEPKITYYTLRRNHRFVQVGSTIGDPATTLTIGYRVHYIDPNF